MKNNKHVDDTSFLIYLTESSAYILSFVTLSFQIDIKKMSPVFNSDTAIFKIFPTEGKNTERKIF